MNNKITNLTITGIPDSHHHKVLFKVHDRAKQIISWVEQGILIKVDKTLEYGCAYFDNLQDYNDFKDQMHLRTSV